MRKEREGEIVDKVKYIKIGVGQAQRGPRESPAKRVSWGEEEQGSVWSFRRRRKRNAADFATTRQRVGLRKWIARLNGWTVAWYAFLTLAGVLLFKAGAAYALRERGYHAVGGEALVLLLPVLYYCAAATVRDIIEDWRERR